MTKSRVACCCKNCRKHGGTEASVEDETEARNRAVMLGSTLKDEELLNTDIKL